MSVFGGSYLAMSLQSAPRRRPWAEYPHRIAFSIQVGRNLVLQGVGIAMVALMGLGTLPWPAVVLWTSVIILVAASEQGVLRRVAGSEGSSKAATLWAPALRFLSTTLYAVAAAALIVRGDASERLFAFALISASTINVLMRYYRSPQILIASLSPYILILSAVAFVLARSEWRQGDRLGVVASGFTLVMFGLQLWSARAQLSGAWAELTTREHAADAANRAKSQFLATMSHELRTPLNGVLGMAQALAADALTGPQQERVKVIRRSSQTLLAVLNDLLDLSKIEAGALTLEVVEFDLEHLVRGVAAVYQPQAEKRGLTFDLAISESASGLYLGDSARVRRILYGLCDNAVKFTPTGGVSVQVDYVGERLAFSVSDTGIGIGPSDLQHLFEGFFQADGTFTRQYGGAGLGLAICHELAGLMDGAIEASSQVGEGSTFMVRLPLARCAPAFAKAPAAATPDEQGDRELRVLAAEDNPTNQLVIKALMGAAGIEPILVNDGREALEAWEGQDWDVVLMDVQMPQMNGVDATLAIRRRELETGRLRTPIIAVTANAMTHQISEYRAAGMDDVVTKPVDLTKLLQAMANAMSVAEAARAPRQEVAA